MRGLQTRCCKQLDSYLLHFGVEWALPKGIKAFLVCESYSVSNAAGSSNCVTRQTIVLQGRAEIPSIKRDLMNYLNEMGVGARDGSYKNDFDGTIRTTPDQVIDLTTDLEPKALTGIIEQASMRLFVKHDPDALCREAKPLLKTDPLASVLSKYIGTALLPKATVEAYRAAFAFSPSQQALSACR